MIKLETFRCHDGYITRPAGVCGTMGWSPFPRTATWGRTPEASRQRFWTEHRAGYNKWRETATTTPERDIGAEPTNQPPERDIGETQ